MRADQNTLWVVYQTGSTPKQPSRNAVCTQAEWDEKERISPGLNTLIRGGIPNEGVAERMARDLQTPPITPKQSKAGGRGASPVPLTESAG